VTTPGLDDDDGFSAAAKPFEAETLVAQSAVEALVRSVLPGFPRVDEGAADVLDNDPLEDRLADEFGAVVRVQVARGAVYADELRELERLKELERENKKLKTLVADLALDKQILQEALSERF
jgi:hypothetical protein